MAIEKPIIYIRGLNTYGTDLLTFGPVPLPMPMHAPWVRFFKSQGAKVYAIAGLGGDKLHLQIERAHRFLLSIKDELNDGFHIVGHSAGGLIGWGLSSRSEWRDRVLSLTTMATPHHGSVLAEVFLEMARTPSFKMKVIRACGYDNRTRIPIFEDFTREGVRAFKQAHPLPQTLKLQSYSFSMKPEEMSWPIRCSQAFGLSIQDREHDGFVELESQVVGQHLGHYALDHSSQIGYHFYVNPRERALRAKLFRDLTFDLCQKLEAL